ncbi:DUF6230 family protein [Fredinandcohnia sp. 179-A 10B2 NHS]|uniref:DUF6230 family protein n=1 Tax=Fredinandcohnia sp. 179-A 10B2 NHS TaxID=3235176 RepID=UPI0039A29DA3
MRESIQENEVVGKTNKKRFFLSLTSGFVFLGLIGFLFGFTGTGYAVPIAGVGDFYVEFDRLEGDGYVFYPKLGDTSSASSVPQGTNIIDKLTIDGLILSKEFKLGEKWIKVKITASKPVQITGLQHDATEILANAKFNGLVLREQTSTNWQDQFRQESDKIILENAKLKTHYLFQKTITMDGMRLTVETIDK